MAPAVRGENLREYSGREKAAMLLITLGPERSAQIFKHLKEDEIEQLTLEIANIRSVTTQDKDRILRSSIRSAWLRNILRRAVSVTRRIFLKKLSAPRKPWRSSTS